MITHPVQEELHQGDTMLASRNVVDPPENQIAEGLALTMMTMHFLLLLQGIEIHDQIDDGTLYTHLTEIMIEGTGPIMAGDDEMIQDEMLHPDTETTKIMIVDETDAEGIIRTEKIVTTETVAANMIDMTDMMTGTASPKTVAVVDTMTTDGGVVGVDAAVQRKKDGKSRQVHCFYNMQSHIFRKRE